MKTRDEAIAMWQQYVLDAAKIVDPSNERDWFDMAYGFFLALEFTAEDAIEMACYLMKEGLL